MFVNIHKCVFDTDRVCSMYLEPIQYCKFRFDITENEVSKDSEPLQNTYHVHKKSSGLVVCRIGFRPVLIVTDTKLILR